MAFADLMAQLNQGVGNLTGTPMGQLGMSLLAASGPQAGNPGGAARFGQALAGMSELQRAQALNEYRQQMVATQQADHQMRQQQAQARIDQQQRQQDAFSDPEFLATLGPMARLMAQHGLDPQQVIRAQQADNLQQHRAAQLQQLASQFDQRQARIGAGDSGAQSSVPRQRALPTLIPEHLPNGMIQDHRLNPQTGEFEPWGSPYSKYAPGRAKTNKAVDAVADELAPAPEQSGLDALPGNGNLQSYAPQSGPVGVMPMSAGGSLAQAKTKPAGSADDNLKAANAAIASGKSRQAVVSRLMQAGYTAEQIQAAGI